MKEVYTLLQPSFPDNMESYLVRAVRVERSQTFGEVMGGFLIRTSYFQIVFTLNKALQLLDFQVLCGFLFLDEL